MRVRLGWTQRVDGEIVPYSTIDCDGIARMIALDESARPMAGMKYRHLSARVVAHELLHVLLHTSEHGGTVLRRWRVESGTFQQPGWLSAEEIAALQPRATPEQKARVIIAHGGGSKAE
jgi:hypothetical protein